MSSNRKAIWSAVANDVWVVGDGDARHYDGVSWSNKTIPAHGTFNAIFGLAANDIYATGDGGTIFHYNGSAWSKIANIPTTTWHMYAIWASSPSDAGASRLLVPDGVFIADEDRLAFALHPVPTSADVVTILDRIVRGSHRQESDLDGRGRGRRGVCASLQLFGSRRAGCMAPTRSLLRRDEGGSRSIGSVIGPASSPRVIAVFRRELVRAVTAPGSARGRNGT